MTVVATKEFDYAIIGAGAAGLHLVHAMMEDSFFSQKKILIIDKSAKDINDRTWCFWETGAGKWDTIAHKIWEKGYFISPKEKHILDMKPYRYKMLRSIDFYSLVKQLIKSAKNITWVEEEVGEVLENNVVEISCGNHKYFAKQVFDSRIDKEFFEAKDESVRILQHFKGWVIETENDVFDPDEFVMMDFTWKWNDSASFTYVLPSSKRTALVEFTLFTPELIADDGYDRMLKEYCDKVLKLGNYKIVEVEKGIIPMTDYPFHKKNTFKITKIGTAGSWVKPSSGYSFKNAERYSAILIKNIKKGNTPSKGIATGRHRKYDSIFLEVLRNRNELGESIFSDMYLKNPASRIFRFLDEQTTLSEDLKIISSFESAPFMEALFKTIKRGKLFA